MKASTIKTIKNLEVEDPQDRINSGAYPVSNKPDRIAFDGEFEDLGNTFYRIRVDFKNTSPNIAATQAINWLKRWNSGLYERHLTKVMVTQTGDYLNDWVAADLWICKATLRKNERAANRKQENLIEIDDSHEENFSC